MLVPVPPVGLLAVLSPTEPARPRLAASPLASGNRQSEGQPQIRPAIIRTNLRGILGRPATANRGRRLTVAVPNG